MLSSSKKLNRRLVIVNNSNTSKDTSTNEQKMLAMIYELTRRYDILETKYNNLQESIISNHQGEKTIMLSEWLHKNYYHPDMLTPSEFLEAHFNVSTEDVLRLEHCTFVELFERIVSNTDWIELHSPVVLVQGFRHEMYWKSSKTTEWEQMSKSNIISFLTHCKKIIFGSVYKYRQQHYEKIKKNEGNFYNN